MEIITEKTEACLVDMLSLVQHAPAMWMSLRVNIAPVHDQILIQEGLSRATLARIHKMSLQIAHKVNEWGLHHFEGKILVFEDSDVLALFHKTAANTNEIIARLRDEFHRSGLINLLAIDAMQEKLAQMITFSEEKILSAEDYRLKRRAVEIGENLLDWSDPDPDLARALQKKRRMRTSGCVLIIDDDVLTRGLVASTVKDDHNVVQAKDAESGIVAYVDHAPNVVFLDIHLPGINGIQLLKRMLQLDRDAYIIMLSADSATDNVLSTQSGGAAGFICKPFSKEKILEYVQKCPSLRADPTMRALGWGWMRGYLRK